MSTSSPKKASKAIVPQARRRWPWLLGGLVAVVWLAPIVASQSPLRNAILTWGAGDLAGSFRCAAADWGWFSSIEFSDVDVLGADGEVIARLPRVASDKPLWRLAFDARNVGTVRIERPELKLVATQSSTNLEELIAPLLNRPISPRFRELLLTIEVTDGAATLSDPITGREWKVEDLDANIKLHQDNSRVHATCSGALVGDSAGRFSSELVLPEESATEETATPHARCAVQAQNAPLAPLTALLRRFDSRLNLAGRATTDLTVTWLPQAIRPSVTVRGQSSVEQFVLAATALGEDRLELARLSLPCDVKWDGRTIDVVELRVDCDLGKATVRGQAPISDFDAPSLVRALAQAKAEAAGDIDLVRVAAALPRTLRLRPETQLTNGRVQFSLSNRVEADQPITTGVFEVTQLAALDRGRPLAWQQPLRLTLQTRDTRGGPQVDKLEIVSDFLRAEASGPWDKLNGTAQYDLMRLTAELRKFFDLAGVELAGQGKGVFNWQRFGDGHFNAYAEMDLANFAFLTPSARPWTEPAAKVTASASGEFDLLGSQSTQRQARLKSVYSAMAKVVAEGDLLQIQLKKPVFNPSLRSPWPIAVTATGDLANWQSRLRAIVSPSGWEFAGAGQLTASAQVSADLVEVAALKANAAPFRVRSANLSIDEPQAEFSLVGQLDRLQGELRIASASFASPSAQLTTENLNASWPTSSGATSARSLAGTILARADLARLHGWLAPTQSPRYRYAGSASANLRFQQQSTATTADAAVEIANLQVIETAPVGPLLPLPAPQQRAIWNESRVAATVAALFDSATDTLKLNRCDVVSEALNVKATGQLAALRGARHIDLAGQIDYDLDRLTLLLRPYLGANVSLSGRGPHSFAIRGPLAAPNVATTAAPVRLASFSKDLAAEAGLSWTGANIGGLTIGPGTLRGQLADGVLRIDPLDLPISEGRLTLAPEVRLSNDPPLLLLPKGSLVKNVKVTPQVSAAALKFVHPFLAGATSVTGRFSVDLEGAHVPIHDARQSQIVGRLKVESVEVSPGPLVTAVLPLLVAAPARQVPLLPDVEFWVENARVYHRGAGIVVAKTTVSTSGSIGFDETLDLVAEVPIPEAWLARSGRLGTALRNQTLKIPIAGTLNRPQIDRRELERLRGQFVGQAAGNLLEGALDRIFQPPAKKQP
jgi:hypothetical protein